jgi:exopolyphosphatase/guanosine-5'-triphosphate,3'-diphosphate pyrophosphatase
MSELHAAIDIGTNSFHLVVARALHGGGFEVVTTEKEMVRLGSGGGDMKRLEPDAIERGVAALTRMVGVARSLGAEVTAVATSAVREAQNRDELLDRVHRELGITIDVISGYEEARLIYHGVIHALPLVDRRVLVVDIGGGSTELIVGQGAELIEARSLRLGAIRITQRFFGGSEDGPAGGERPSKAAVNRCRRYLQDELAMVSRELGGHRPELGVGSSGTIAAVAAMIAAAEGTELRQLSGFTFTAAQLAAAVKRVTHRSADQRRSLPGLDDRRADIILGGILLLQEVVLAFGVKTMTVSEFALREGVLFDRFPADPGHLQNLRRSNAHRLVNQFDPDTDHAETTARIALQLFDRTGDLHHLSPTDRELLEVAGLVHNIGLTVAHSGHHKHTAYIVRNTDQLTGFTEHEIELIALVARYHRKSRPADKHPEFAALTSADKRRVRILAGLLRVAIGLDRRHNGAVKSVTVTGDHDRILIEPVVPTGDDVSLEVFSARARSSLLAEGLKTEVEVRERPNAG